MTKRKRWPLWAEDQRMEALAKAMAIVDLARDAKGAILEDHSGVKAVYLLADIMVTAKEIEALLVDAKRGR